jgi:hypothetical protein
MAFRRRAANTPSRRGALVSPPVATCPRAISLHVRGQLAPLAQTPVSRTPCVALVGHMQPVLRSLASKLVCMLPPQYVDQVLAAALLLLSVEADDS